MVKKINLFIVGGQKCGTSALAAFIAQHEDVCLVAGKEAHVFDQPDGHEYHQEWIDARYAQLTRHYQAQQWLCDATPIYSYWLETHAMMARYNPNAKIIFMVRDPVERAVSQYQMEKTRGNEPRHILTAFLLEKWRLTLSAGSRADQSARRLHSYVDRGHFEAQYQHLCRYFSPQQILVIHNDDLKHHHDATLSRIFTFLDVKATAIEPANVFSASFTAMGKRTTIARLFARELLKKDTAFVARYKITPPLLEPLSNR